MRKEIAQVIKRDRVMELVYGNNSCPKDILGRHSVNNGQVISAYHPDAIQMTLIDRRGKRYEMDRVEQLSLFSVFIPDRQLLNYKIDMLFPDGNHFISEDPYSFPSMITEQEEKLFAQGVWTDCYLKLGAHSMTIRGVKGVFFAVWAPNARRVSVVGDFNYWNGMIYPMHRLSHSGIFELFIPGVTEKQLYRFEVKTWEHGIVQKVDPFGNINIDGNGDTSIILDMKEVRWDDDQWMRRRKCTDWKQSPLSVCDRELNDHFQEEFLEHGCFTHVLLKAPDFCHGLRGSIREWINSLHKRGIGVILQTSLGWFRDEENELKSFDGTQLFDHPDDRIRFDHERGMVRFRHDRKEVVNYITSRLIFWIREYHIDGFLLEGMTDMIYPRTDRDPDRYHREYEFFQNDSVEFLNHVIVAVKKEDFSVLMIGDEKQEVELRYMELLSQITSFDAFINYSIPDNLGKYIADYRERPGEEYHRLTLPLMKNSVGNSLLNLAYDEEEGSERSFLDKVTPNEYDRLSWRKLMIGYMLGVPGSKRWSWKKLESAPIQHYLRNILQIYMSHDCMYRQQPSGSSFSWINGIDSCNRVMSFIRRSSGGGKNLLFLCNFGENKVRGYHVGVPKAGAYRMLINSAWEEFGGSLRKDEVVLEAAPQEWDLQPYSLRVTVLGLSVIIFEY